MTAAPRETVFAAVARPRAWPKLALPLGAGVAAAWSAGYRLEPPALVLLVVFLAGHAMLVFAANDLVDEEADRIRRLYEATPTPKALLDGVVSRRAMGVGALVGLAMVLAAGQSLAMRTGQRAPAVLAMAAVLCVVAYEFAPLRLNYRGGGGIVEALGVGVVLPLMGASACAAGCPRALAFLLPALTLTSLAGAIGSTLADAAPDAEAGKRTFAVKLGARDAARAAAVSLTVASLLSFAASLVGRPSAASVAIALGALFGRVVQSASRWNGADKEGLGDIKRALGAAVRGAWLAATFGFALDGVLVR